MPPKTMSAKDILALVLNDETIDLQDAVPRYISGFDQLIEKIDKLADALQQRGNGEGYENGDGGHSEEMQALVANLQAIRELLDKPAVELPDNSDMQQLLGTIARNTMRRQRPWEFDIQRDRRTGFTDKIIARPIGD